MNVAAPGLLEWASTTASEHLAGLGTRWQHVQCVARLAAAVGHALNADKEQLVAAALLHDIGYSPDLASTGFHPLDGARFVRSHGHERLARLVAHHSGARFEAQLRGIHDFEAEFPFMDSDLDRALTYCDLTTSPSGQRVRLEDRVNEIQHRYGSGHTVSQAIAKGVLEFQEAVRSIEAHLDEAGYRFSGSLAYPR